MAFEEITSKFQGLIKKLKGQSRITSKDVDEMARELKLALLDADVNFLIVKKFIERIKEKALGEKVLNSLTPGQQVIKVVKDELVELISSDDEELKFSTDSNRPTTILLVGLQGSGKTTACAKIANYLRKKGKKPLLVACDVYRPAAIDQLEALAKQINIDFYKVENSKNVLNIAKTSLNRAIKSLNDVVIIDSAGRLDIDENLMNELKTLQKEIKIDQTLLVIDSMIGSVAASISKGFSEQIQIDGLIISKLDGDTRGGAILSAKEITKKPIKFVSNGEKMNDLEKFDPQRMASRILGMGDVLSLIEKAQESFDEEEALKLEEKLKKQKFDLNDYLDQMKRIKKMGPISSLLKMIPGINLSKVNIDDKELTKVEAIIQSMTDKERKNYKLLNASRRIRIAKGSGTSVEAINKFIKSYELTEQMMKKATSKKGLSQMMKAIQSGDFKNI